MVRLWWCTFGKDALLKRTALLVVRLVVRFRPCASAHAILSPRPPRILTHKERTTYLSRSATTPVSRADIHSYILFTLPQKNVCPKLKELVLSVISPLRGGDSVAAMCFFTRRRQLHRLSSETVLSQAKRRGLKRSTPFLSKGHHFRRRGIFIKSAPSKAHHQRSTPSLRKRIDKGV